MARRSLSRLTRCRFRSWARPASDRSHGRLVRCARLSMTGPATSKQADVAWPPVSVRKAATIGCKPSKSALWYSFSATNWRGPVSGETRARRVLVPPISPAISIRLSPSGFALLLSLCFQSGARVGLRKRWTEPRRIDGAGGAGGSVLQRLIDEAAANPDGLGHSAGVLARQRRPSAANSTWWRYRPRLSSIDQAPFDTPVSAAMSLTGANQPIQPNRFACSGGHAAGDRRDTRIGS